MSRNIWGRIDNLKVLYIMNGNGLSSGIGGSLVRTTEIAKRLVEAGCHIYFLTTHGGSKACQSMGLDVHYYLLPASIFKQNESSLFDRAVAYVISTIAAFWMVPRLPKCDLVYSDSDYFCDTIPAVLYKRVNGTPWVAMTHHRIKINKGSFRNFLVSSISSKLQLFSYFLLKRYADKIFVYKSAMGKSIAEQMISSGFLSSDIEMVTNGVDVEFIEAIPCVPKIYDACFVGGLRPGKGLYDIVHIWEAVVSQKKNASLIIIGDTTKEYEREILAQIHKKGLELQIELAGSQSHDKVIKIMKASKILISPSQEEGWGIAICEAMICGLPVIAYDLATYEEVFGDGIRKTPYGDIPEFAQAVLGFLNSDDLRIEVGARGRLSVSQYDWNTVAIKELNYFRKLLRRE